MAEPPELVELTVDRCPSCALAWIIAALSWVATVAVLIAALAAGD